jgi:PAS domain S-box-containing protein/putative nucleotidyltransferase with HDIG domain
MNREETVQPVLTSLAAGGRPESDDLLTVLFEQAPDAYYLSDTRGKFIGGNRAAEALLGYRREELVGKNFLDLDILPRDQIAKALKLLALNVLRRSTGPDEFTLKRRDGSRVLVEIMTHPVKIKGRTVVLGIARDITERKKVQELQDRDIQRLTKSRDAVIQAISSISEMRDPYTAGHQKRVADLARAIAVEMKLSPDQVDTIRDASLIHDLGKVSVPAEILCKPGRLDEAEISLVREHPTIGYDILKSIDMFEKIAEIVYQHHERMDGSGYPRGLRGQEILLETRILSVAEAVEAMLSHRPYRRALTIEQTLEEITQQKGILFDPLVVETCVRLFVRKKFKLGS